MLFGVVTLMAVPFYLIQAGCGQGHAICTTRQSGLALDAFSGIYPFALPSIWFALYWVAAILLVYALTFVHYRRRGSMTRLHGRVWPTIAAGLCVMALISLTSVSLRAGPVSIGEFRTEPLIIVAVSLGVLARTERSWWMGLITMGYSILVGLSLFYSDVNEVQRLGLGAPFGGSASVLPNLLVPGAYLVVGALLLRRSMRLPGYMSEPTHD